MAAEPPPPAEVGARGTIGSLVSQEIEYFRRLNPDHQEASTSGNSKQKTCSSREVQRRRRRRKKKKFPASGRFLPSMCSAVDVIDTKGIEKAGSIGYKNLRTDGKKVPED